MSRGGRWSPLWLASLLKPQIRQNLIWSNSTIELLAKTSKSKKKKKNSYFLDLRWIWLVLTKGIKYVRDEDKLAWVEVNDTCVRKKLWALGKEKRRENSLSSLMVGTLRPRNLIISTNKHRCSPVPSPHHSLVSNITQLDMEWDCSQQSLPARPLQSLWGKNRAGTLSQRVSAQT